MALERSRTAFRAGALGAAGVFLLTVLTPVGVAQARENGSLQPGDAVRLSFWREPELSGEYPVDENSVVVLPLVGARAVRGMPPSELKQTLLTEFGSRLRNQEVQITLLQRVRILGAVRDPGLYHVDATMTLGDAVALAGGTTPNGTLEGIRIVREGESIRADLNTETLVAEQVLSGDQILVRERGWLSRYGTFMVGSVLTIASFFVYANYRR